MSYRQKALLSIQDLATTQEIPTDIDLLSVYNETLAGTVTNRRLPGIHASEISSCVRSSVYTLLDTPAKVSIDPNMRERFNVGHAVHELVQRNFSTAAGEWSRGKLHFLFKPEVRVDDTEYAIAHSVSSSCDGVFSIYDDQNLILRVGLEIKTEAPDAFKSLTAPRQKHLEQAHLYMRCLDLPLMWFLYINKGNQQMTPMKAPWLVQFSPVVWEKVEQRIQVALEGADKRILPDREEGFHCSWCPYGYTCAPNVLSAVNRKPPQSITGAKVGV